MGAAVNYFLAFTCQTEFLQLRGFKTDTELDLFLPDNLLLENEMFFNQMSPALIDSGFLGCV